MSIGYYAALDKDKLKCSKGSKQNQFKVDNQSTVFAGDKLIGTELDLFKPKSFDCPEVQGKQSYLCRLYCLASYWSKVAEKDNSEGHPKLPRIAKLQCSKGGFISFKSSKIVKSDDKQDYSEEFIKACEETGVAPEDFLTALYAANNAYRAVDPTRRYYDQLHDTYYGYKGGEGSVKNEVENPLKKFSNGLLFTTSFEKTGESCSVYQNEKGDLIVSFPGTSSNRDWFNNIEHGLVGGLSGEAKFNMEVAKAVQRYKNANPGAKVIYTGHSQGGYDAQVAAYYSGDQAIIFDAEGIMGSTIKEIRKNSGNMTDPAIVNFNTQNCILTNIQENRGIILRALSKFPAFMPLASYLALTGALPKPKGEQYKFSKGAAKLSLGSLFSGHIDFDLIMQALVSDEYIIHDITNNDKNSINKEGGKEGISYINKSYENFRYNSKQAADNIKRSIGSLKFWE